MSEVSVLPGFSLRERLYLGAEAELLRGTWASKDVVVKRRITKAYRRKELDTRIIWFRTIREVTFMHEAKMVGVRTPRVYHVNPESGVIVMSFEGFPTLRKAILSRERFDPGAIGESIGLLHIAGIAHGDLTPSNILLAPSEPILLDFGLSDKTTEDEMFAEDLYLLGKSLEQLVPQYTRGVFDHVLEGYARSFPGESARVRAKLQNISKRGRYVRRGMTYGQ